MAYDKLFEPGYIGKVKIKNRLVMSPMNTHFSIGDPAVLSERYFEYYKARARGGVGLIITTHVKAEKNIDPYPLTYGYATFDSVSQIKYFNEITEMAHRYDAKIAIELSPGTGRLADATLKDKWPVGPSEIEILGMPGVKTRALTKDEIHGLVEAYGKAAGLAKQAGFDIIYVHFTAYLGDQFLSSAWNHRTDEYGGSLENRMRFLLECIESARNNVGSDFPMIVGLALDHGFPGGRELDETIEIAKRLKQIGIDTLHLRRGSYDNMNLLIPTEYMEDAVSVDYAAKVREQAGIQVISDGNISDPVLANKLMEENKLDFVGLGRALLADPEWVNKVRADKKEDIVPCVRCMQCINRIFFGQYAACSVNPVLGKEYLSPILPAKKPKKVLVIGGGMAGMAFAKMAEEKGHDVTLLESTSELGGHLLEGAVMDHKKEVDAYCRHLVREIKNSGVKVKYNTRATKELVKELNPDAVVVATGSVPVIPDVPGIDRPNVRIATKLLKEGQDTGQNVIIVGGGLVGCETGLHLAEKGKKVTIIDMLPEVAQDVIFMARFSLLEALKNKGIETYGGLKLTEITESGIVVEDSNGDKKEMACDTVVIAVGLKADDTLYNELVNEFDEVYRIGDCIKARKFIDAIQEAFQVAVDI
ncbi:MAG TPA: FAD-dependent oxidoreductase [Hungateiclostridium thermocellum]|uniref:NADH:flavin oxidoreductase/NADH oxidase n=1 Tax=Acetivibrio thermocellus (strain ATCC 27405 / DSM 1237 / JCM 9322 / NBRC 103400 / NCIMB 10682 / NRRL B-4536 / VPI 7372) TaxID=203119 RepID=A3DJQ8_ACET2|nr:NAD(P)/FAD-dependent oxidoreductase [Acetivibrio thermocellus]ABN54187.1 NADH:flavin oxidoreductase/NADH oxidase [Acetivibrio thermocellus ATCC 27405]HBW27775.1 FAD-dependent oxidoreductase [Acetivibrio thermocellus]